MDRLSSLRFLHRETGCIPKERANAACDFTFFSIKARTFSAVVMAISYITNVDAVKLAKFFCSSKRDVGF